MTKKLTEEQYQKIVDIADSSLQGNETFVESIPDILHSSFLSNISKEEMDMDSFKELERIVTLIVIHESRDWAHDQFVEKEKKYIWKTKKKDSEKDCLILYKIVDTGGILTDFKSKTTPDPITESEMREWGYNPDMYEREEVE
ncbi:hypothetical protein GHU05_04885 [Fructobacillus tropaeoli]|uniref:hypothetical protein n=1 Tax=Fructobacillus tropaeoli TaxID=709323 RepID=UPI0014562341|nr:hypothetical protein [Fructobacillus tropaeoli]NLS38263.1 hypothetical protein [Fructobacillus tropaeoli]